MLADDLKDLIRGFFSVLKALATGVLYLGMGALFVMSVVGTVAIDIVILAALLTSKNNSAGSFFLTGYLWGTLISSGSGRSSGVGAMMLASPFLTGLAIVLSVYLGVPGVGWALGMGWAIAGSLALVGVALVAVADAFLNASFLQKSHERAPVSVTAEPKMVSSSHQTSMAPLLSPTRPTTASVPRDPDVYVPLYAPSAPPQDAQDKKYDYPSYAY